MKPLFHMTMQRLRDRLFGASTEPCQVHSHTAPYWVQEASSTEVDTLTENHQSMFQSPCFTIPSSPYAPCLSAGVCPELHTANVYQLWPDGLILSHGIGLYRRRCISVYLECWSVYCTALRSAEQSELPAGVVKFDGTPTSHPSCPEN
jgi:hypothetical protein